MRIIKNLFPCLLVGCVVAWGTQPVAAATNNLKMHGALVAEPCTLQPGDENIELDFGTVIDKNLYQNQRTLSKPFQLRLMDCDTSLGKTLKMTFSGTESVALPGLLALEGGSEASGIAIGLETQDGQPLALNQKSRGQQITDGNNVITLQAYVKGAPEAITHRNIERGMFAAVATFALEYE
ncbi:putative fimbrial-like protein YfcP [Serratia plymuthica]|uniref:fimbrial protein n=1 Tax=Serratia plymuthica TaxID=82996 RepID=UPI0003473FE9|nr:fimbrial protein [Serratia plymuthica]QJW53201.1 putative fimbrial-like protein YfcP [Serratia plymuthica]